MRNDRPRATCRYRALVSPAFQYIGHRRHQAVQHTKPYNVIELAGLLLGTVFATGLSPYGVGLKNHSLWDWRFLSNFYMNGPLLPFTTASRCCGTDRRSSHLRMAQHFFHWVDQYLYSRFSQSSETIRICKTRFRHGSKTPAFR